MSAVATGSRYTRDKPCPVCAGYPALPQGRGVRCYGFRKDDPDWAVCTRYASPWPLSKGDGWSHLVGPDGHCQCVEGHGQSAPSLPARRVNAGGRPPVSVAGAVTKETVYRLTDADGTHVANHVRIDRETGKKTMFYTLPDGTNTLGGLAQTALPLYGIDRLGGSQYVVMVEGEKATDSLLERGVPAVGTACGAGSADESGEVVLSVKCPDDTALALLTRAGLTVYLWPDNDTLGRAHMDAIAEALVALGQEDVYGIDWPDAPPKGDAADYVSEGGDTRALLDAARRYESSPSAAPSARIARPGGDAILDAPTEIPALWGSGSDVVHASGEALMVVGPDGVGKTTIVQQYSLAMMGLGESLLGLPVRPLTGTLLYLAMDRPQQAERSMRRMVSEADRDLLNARLRVWEGPMPIDILADPLSLLTFVREQSPDVQVVVVDSLKDAVLALTEDKTGGAWNMARQHLLANGIEVVEIHHQRKQQNGSPPPRSLADVYGSRWLTAGAGSVVCLWGDAGDPVVAFSHLKQPANEVGPFNVLIDHETGRVTRAGDRDLLTLLRGATTGLTIPDLASLKFEKDSPTKAEVEKVRRELRRLDGSGLVREQPASKGGPGGSTPARWFAIDSRHEPPEQSRVNHAPSSRDSSTEQPRQSRGALSQVQEVNHASNHANHGLEQSRFPASLVGGNASGNVDEDEFDRQAAEVKTWSAR